MENETITQVCRYSTICAAKPTQVEFLKLLWGTLSTGTCTFGDTGVAKVHRVRLTTHEKQHRQLFAELMLLFTSHRPQGQKIKQKVVWREEESDQLGLG